MAGWKVVSTERLTLHRTNRLAEMYVLSPYVWRDGSDYRMLLRAVPRRDDNPRLKISEIWHGRSDDGLVFDMDVAPAIFPGPGQDDLDGCEDPTVLVDAAGARVWYTGYNAWQETGRLLLARGPDVGRLAKAGVAIDSSLRFTNPKEATVAARPNGGWRMFMEYASDGASRIGQADTDDLDGQWTGPVESALSPRDGQWDGWHLSPGPIVGEGGDAPTIFYNGASPDANWRIGWATLDAGLDRVVERCAEPLIAPDLANDVAGTDIAFVASAIEEGDEVRLYYSVADRDLRCALLRRE